MLDATERLLAEKRLEELTVADVIAAAGTSRASFYFYFESKQAVVAALLGRVIDEIYDAARPFLERDAADPPEKSLRECFAGVAASWRRHAPVLQAAVEGWRSSPEIGDLWGSYMARFTKAAAAQIERDRASGVAPPGPDARPLAAALLWMNERCFYVASIGAESALRRQDALADALVGVWLPAVYGARA